MPPTSDSTIDRRLAPLFRCAGGARGELHEFAHESQDDEDRRGGSGHARDPSLGTK